MSNANKPRFFIEHDLVRHKPTGVVYEVHGEGWYEDYVAIFYNHENGNVNVRVIDTENHFRFPFDELELVESAGVYMGVGKTPDFSSLSLDMPKFYEQPTITHPIPPKPVKANSVTWLFFGAYGISRITMEMDISWYVYFQDGKSEAIEPANARTFLDAIGLTEDLEPRIGNQAMWDSVLGKDE